jgi:hypothetical protein
MFGILMCRFLRGRSHVKGDHLLVQPMTDADSSRGSASSQRHARGRLVVAECAGHSFSRHLYQTAGMLSTFLFNPLSVQHGYAF